MGTGSYPDPPQGLHLSILLIERYVPLIEPNLSIAILEYSEQVGVYLQELCQGPGIF